MIRATNPPSRLDANSSQEDLLDAVRQLVERHRDRCLWFLVPDFAPKDVESALRALTYIQRYGSRDAFVDARRLRQWFSPRSRSRSAV